MTKLTIKLPESLKEQAREVSDTKNYQNLSEYVRAALRQKVEEDLVAVRIEEDDSETLTLSEAKKLIGRSHEGQNQKESVQERPESPNQ